MCFCGACIAFGETSRVGFRDYVVELCCILIYGDCCWLCLLVGCVICLLDSVAW